MISTTKYLPSAVHLLRPILSCRRTFSQKRPRMAETAEEIEIGSLRVIPRSVSGLETSIVVQGVKGSRLQDLHVTFDLGCATRANVACQHIFISHGHTDHIAGIASHAAKRSLYNMRPASYYIPGHLEEPLHSIGETFSKLNESEEGRGRIRTCVVSPTSEPIKLPHGYYVKVFPTQHRVASQGYIVYRSEKLRKPEYENLKNEDMRELIKSGVDRNDFSYTKETPVMAYTGDTLPEIYDEPFMPDLLRVPLLITEATYIDDKPSAIHKAREWGHTHLQELINRKELFKGVEKILLVHFSDKYSVRYIRQRTEEMLPNDLKQKIVLGCTSLNRP